MSQRYRTHGWLHPAPTAAVSLGLILQLLLVFFAPASAAGTLKVYTEELPPFSYTLGGELRGVSTAIVRAVLDKAGLDHQIVSLPWARTYKLARETPNALIYSISRREQREGHFKWIAPIIPTVRYSVFALKSRRDIRIERFSDLGKYQIGTTVNDAREVYLLNRGLSVDDLQRVSGSDSHRVNYEKLKRGRIELWPMPDAVMSYVVRDAGDEPGAMLRRVFGFSELTSSGYYLAASLDTPDAVVEQLRAEIQGFTQTDEYEALLDQWGLGTEGTFANQDIR